MQTLMREFVRRRCRRRRRREIWKFWRSGDLEIWEFGIPKIPKNKVLKIKIRVAQNVGKVWINTKNPPDPLSGHFRQFFPWAGRMQNMQQNSHMFAIQPVWGSCCYPPLVGHSSHKVNMWAEVFGRPGKQWVWQLILAELQHSGVAVLLDYSAQQWSCVRLHKIPIKMKMLEKMCFIALVSTAE